MRILIIISVLLLAFSSTAMTEAEAAARIRTADGHYENGDIQEAVEAYLSVAEEYSSRQLNYNLGNGYYRLGKIPNAILYYERALRFDPQNEDILHNLSQARLLTVDKIESDDGRRFSHWWRSTLLQVGPAKWAAFSIVCALLALVGGIIFLFVRGRSGRKGGVYLGVGAAILCLFFMWFSLSSKGALLRTSEAIITTPKVEILSAPNPVSTELLILHEGTKVEVLRESSGWYEIRIPNGEEGWLEVKDVTVI